MFGNKKVQEMFLFSQNIIYFCLKLIYFRITHFDELFVFCNFFWHCLIATPCICTADITSYSRVYLRDISLKLSSFKRETRCIVDSFRTRTIIRQTLKLYISPWMKWLWNDFIVKNSVLVLQTFKFMTNMMCGIMYRRIKHKQLLGN